jgi:hypothetical protein
MTKDPKAKETEAAADGSDYQRKYYLSTRKDRLKAHRQRWDTDEEFRKSALDRAKEERASVRAAKAHAKFAAMIEKARADEETRKRKQAERGARRPRSARGPRKPRERPYGLRKVSLSGRADDLVEIYPGGTFATAIGRKTETIRDWLKASVLPGASIFLGGKAYYTESFIQAVYRACEALYFKDGNGRLDILRKLIMRELSLAGESYVAPGSTERRRLRPSDAPAEERDERPHHQTK